MPRAYKDLFPRYKTMQGFYVERKGGWDTHGLPVELEVEKEIGVNSKPEIEAYGVERFVERCKESVWRYKAEWERMIERMGFWIDLESAYVTYTDGYIETVWWMLAEMFRRDLLYQGHKVLPYCPRCGTGLSSHEVAQGYQRVEDPSLSVRMMIVSDKGAQYEQERPTRTALLTWTTTPWTLPANVALAIDPGATYVEVEQNGERGAAQASGDSRAHSQRRETDQHPEVPRRAARLVRRFRLGLDLDRNVFGVERGIPLQPLLSPVVGRRPGFIPPIPVAHVDDEGPSAQGTGNRLSFVVRAAVGALHVRLSFR